MQENFGKICDRRAERETSSRWRSTIMRKNKDVVRQWMHWENKGGVIVTDEGEIRDRWKE